MGRYCENVTIHFVQVGQLHFCKRLFFTLVVNKYLVYSVHRFMFYLLAIWYIPWHFLKHIVASRPVARQRLQKKQLYNSHYWVTASQTSMSARQQLETTTEKRCFLCSPCRDAISRTVCESQLRVDSSSSELLWESRQLVRTWARKQRTLLRSVIRQRLVKT
jgi:hypothetical protein